MIHDGGIDLTAELSDRYPDLTTLVYSGETNVEFVRRSLSAGASAYLVKGSGVAVIKQAIEVVMAGGIYLDPALPEKPRKEPIGYTLTPKEEQVMRLFSKWMTRKEIAHALKITRVGVNAHCINIAYKLDLKNPVAFYREAIRRYGNPDVV
jgi:DNA-binding NarL/FixJ family response regulator